jgi:hypothetical protein
MPTSWAILTGEYPPQPGGVADYTERVAEGLMQAGDAVDVFAPPAVPVAMKAGVRVHRLPGNFNLAARTQAERILQMLPRPRRILVQYVPHAFGARAMNVPFALWVKRLARKGESVDIMFHEVAYPMEAGQPWKHRLLALVTRRMALWIGKGADRIYISTQGWEPMLLNIGLRRPMQWLPVPSNIACVPAAAAIEEVRRRFAGSVLIAHFGTYGQLLSALEETLRRLAEGDASRQFLLLGRGGSEFAARFSRAYPALAERFHATGPLDPEPLAAHLAAASIMVQPYPDGVSCRRSSTMAGLALGVAVVTCSGIFTESIWAESRAVALAKNCTAAEIAAAAEALLANPSEILQLAKRASTLYETKFKVSNTIAALRQIA